MTTELRIQTRDSAPITPEEADRITTWWPRLLTLPLADREERDVVAAQISRLSQPADGAWMMARIAALLSPYYTGDVPHGVRVMEAEDWAEALAEYPQWAISKAVRWWKGADNERRRQKPLEGDIAARARVEMGALIVARRAVERFGARAVPARDHSPARPVDPAVADEIVRAAGFAIKRMPTSSVGAAE